MNPNLKSPIANRQSDSLLTSESPWPGLASFTEELRGFFHGREKETEELVRLVRRQTLTVLFGQSGLGKSSLLQAGAFPLLREADFLPLYLRLEHDAAAPALAEQVKSALTATFAAAGADAPPFRADETLWEYFHRKDIDIWSAKNRLLTPILAFDQFEEIFTLGRADEARRERGRAFLAELADLVENRPPAAVRAKFESGELDPVRYAFDKPSCQVILCLREDFLPDLEGLKNEMRSILHNRMRVRRLNGTQALEIVSKPAPHLLADGVAERIVEFVAGARGGSAERLAELEVEPALLSVICRELNERRRTLGQDKITADLVAGNRREILTDFYERCVSDLPDGVRAFVEDHLLTKSGFRDNLALETALEQPGVTRPLIDTLVARRLLRIEDRIGVQRVELTHDVLAEVIRAARDSRQQRLALKAAAQRTRHQRWVIAGLVAAVVALGIGAVFGLRAQRRAAEHAGRSDLLLGSRLLDEGKIADGLSYLVNAARKDPNNELVAPRILTTLVSRNFTLPVGQPFNLPSPALQATILAGGRLAVVQGEDDILRLVDLNEGRVLREYRFEQKVVRGGFATAKDSADVVACSLEDFSLLVCDTETGRPRFAAIPAVSDPAGGRFIPIFRLSPDGRSLAIYQGRSLRLVDTATGAIRAVVQPAVAFYTWAGFQPFSPDGTRIAVTSPVMETSPDGSFRVVEWLLELRSTGDGKVLGKMNFPFRDRSVSGTAFSADGKRLLVFGFGLAESSTGHVQVFEAGSGEPVGPPFLVPFSTANDIWLTPDGTRVVTMSDNRDATVIDAATGKPVFPPLIHGGPVYGVGISDDSRTLATNCVDGFFRLWDLTTGKLAAEPTFKQERYATVATSRDARTVVVFSAAGAVHRLKLTSGAAAPLVLPRSAATVMVQFVPKPPARLLWLLQSEARAIDAASGRPAEGGFKYPFAIERIYRRPYGATLEPGEAVFAWAPDAPARVWTMGENRVAHDVALADGFENSGQTGIAFSSSARRAARRFPASGPDRATVIYDLQSGQRVGAIKTEINTLNFDQSAAPFSPDDRRIALQMTGSAAPLRVYEIADGRLLYTLQLSGRAVIRAFRFSADGTRLYTGDSWGSVQVWDATNGKLLRASQAHRTVVTRFDFSRDGKYYSSLSTDGSVQVWEASTDAPVGAPLVQTGAPARVFFSPDSTRIITPSRGGTTRVWDVDTGLPLNDPMEHDGVSVSVVAFSPDGRFVTTQAGQNTPASAQRLWAAPPVGRGRTPRWLIELATICAGQRLTEEGKFASAADALAGMDEIRREVAGLPTDAPYAEWGRWFLSDSPTRPIAPGFTITPAEAKKLGAEFAALVPTIPPRPASPAGAPKGAAKKAGKAKKQ